MLIVDKNIWVGGSSPDPHDLLVYDDGNAFEGQHKLPHPENLLWRRRLACLQRRMLGWLREEYAKEGHGEQHQQYFKSRQVTAAYIADIPCDGSSQAADKSIEGHCIAHNFGEFGTAEIVGEYVSHGNRSHPLTYAIDDSVCKDQWH